MCLRISNRSTTSAGAPSRPRLRLLGCRRASASYTAATICSSARTRSAYSIQPSRRSPTSPAIKPSPKLSCALRISITPLPPAPGHRARGAQQVVIELADRLDRLLQFLVVVQPAAHLGNALAAHTELAHAAAPIAHREDIYLVSFAARAFGAAALMTNGALKQRATQELAGDRQLGDKLLASLQGSIPNRLVGQKLQGRPD